LPRPKTTRFPQRTGGGESDPSDIPEEAPTSEVDANTRKSHASLGPRDHPQRFEAFLNLTARWEELGIGPVRTPYYLALLASDLGEHDPLGFGGFPIWPHSLSRAYATKMSDLKISRSARVWLACDLWLSDVLCAFGLRWREVEQSISCAFLRSMPARYQPLLETVPAALQMMVWRNDLSRWRLLMQRGRGIRKDVEHLAKLIGGTYAGQYDGPALENLARMVSPPSWTLDDDRASKDVESQLKDRSRAGSPVERAVYRELEAQLWPAIELQTERPFDQPALWNGVPPFIQASLKKAGGSSIEQRPVGFWFLLADLAFHVPLIRGLPDRRFFEKPLSMDDFDSIQEFEAHIAKPADLQSANAIRLLVRRQVVV
jgi:hypothetical protein